jgi:hypothetical protein
MNEWPSWLEAHSDEELRRCWPEMLNEQVCVGGVWKRLGACTPGDLGAIIKAVAAERVQSGEFNVLLGHVTHLMSQQPGSWEAECELDVLFDTSNS